MSESLISLGQQILQIATSKGREIQKTVSRSKTLSLNAMILATKAGSHGAGFAVVAREAVEIANAIDQQAVSLSTELTRTLDSITRIGHQVQGQRLRDLALHLIEIIDRNLYERSCDVRWWATDAAVVDCLASNTPRTCAHAAHRLGIILDSYTVYADIWICRPDGQVIANGRPDRYPEAVGSSVAQSGWFTRGLATTAGDQFAVGEVSPNQQLNRQQILTYATTVRANGDIHGAVLGVIGIHFDWQTQSQLAVDGVRLHPGEREHTRCCIVDANGLILAASNHQGILTEIITLPEDASGHLIQTNSMLGYALTPGYESYRGLGWRGVISQKLEDQ